MQLKNVNSEFATFLPNNLRAPEIQEVMVTNTLLSVRILSMLKGKPWTDLYKLAQIKNSQRFLWPTVVCSYSRNMTSVLLPFQYRAAQNAGHENRGVRGETVSATHRRASLAGRGSGPANACSLSSPSSIILYTSQGRN